MSVESVSEILRAWLREHGYAVHAAGATMPLEGDREASVLRQLADVALDAGAVPEVVFDEEPTMKMQSSITQQLVALSSQVE